MLGCTSISLGLPQGKTEVANSSVSIALAIDMVFDYFVIAEHSTKASRTFAINSARSSGHDPVTAELKINPNTTELEMSSEPISPVPFIAAPVTTATTSPIKGDIFILYYRYLFYFFGTIFQ